MPERSGKANRWHTTVHGHFVNHWYELFGQRQYDQFFLTDARWQKFLIHPDTKSFTYMNVNMPTSLITLRREKRANGQFWYAFKKVNGKLYKVYAGKSEELTYERLQEALKALQAKIWKADHESQS